jgi:DNA-binding beta-propeller fold protein YncE
MRTRNLYVGAAFLVVLAALGIGQAVLEKTAAAQAQRAVQAPMFEVDPFWPKPLPNHWLLGMSIGVSVDAQDHVWIIHRGAATLNPRTEVGADANPPIGECCLAAPPVLEFDPVGNLVGHWGGPGQGYEWPESNHGITVDFKGNVWIGGNGRAPTGATGYTGPYMDSQLLKFTKDGKLLLQVGRKGKSTGSHDTENFKGPAKIFVDPRANEAYIADGYGNKRVAVIDADTGTFKRYWGAYGNKPDDTDLGRYNPDAPPAQQFRNPVHCAELSNDGLLYVCDRPNDRIQVFKPDGTFVKEVFIAKRTLGDGSVWDIAFSKDPQQRYLYLADGKNEKVYIIQRDTLDILTSFGDGGRQPGQFFGVHSIATDSKGNIYTTETYEGKRLQKFVYKGLGGVTKTNQGAPWPRSDSQPTNDLANPYQTIERWGTLPEGRTWGSTSAVDIDRDGRSIWVAERCGTNSCAGSDLPVMLKFDPSGKLVASFGGGMFIFPHGIHVDREGNIWVTDARAATPQELQKFPTAAGKGHVVVKFSPAGEVLLTLGKPGVAGDPPDAFNEPCDVVTAPNGDIFVADGHAGQNANAGPANPGRIVKFSKDGKFIKAWGRWGSAPGEFKTPHGVAFDSRGRLFVADRGNVRLQIFDQDGKFLDEWKQFSRLSGIYIDKNDVLYGADSESNSRSNPGWKRGLRIGSARDGKVIAFIPDPEPDPDKAGTSGAEGVAADAQGNVFGAEVGPRMVKKYVKKS